METASRMRPNFERIRRARGETRSAERLKHHFAVEAALARRLLESDRSERSHLYADVYRQLFESVPDHPQHRGDQAIRLDRIEAQVAMLRRWLGPNTTYVEIGCGDAALTKAIARYVHATIGVDVTPALVGGPAPEAFRFVQSDGVTLEIPANSADLVFSNQLMEHLHVEDAVAQLREIHRILKPGGRYICCTPNRLTGPHDISVYFGDEPTGLHMREYDHRSLNRLFRSVGFRYVRATMGVEGRWVNLPVRLATTAESLAERLPFSLGTLVLSHPRIALLAGVNLVGTK
jgi:SAM-dependent methyltransferase